VQSSSIYVRQPQKLSGDLAEATAVDSSDVTFDFHSHRFSFVARDRIQFPAVMPANVLRGGFGLTLRRTACTCANAGTHSSDCVYARLFEPAALSGGPSGFQDQPRPFVFRARTLDGRTIEAGEFFSFEMNVFEMRFAVGTLLESTFSELAAEGLGPTRGRAELLSVGDRSHSLELSVEDTCSDHVEIAFLTPTELKGGEEFDDRPLFSVLFARIRDRLSTLRSLYGAGPLDIDFGAMAERASTVALTRCDVRQTTASRRSTRTGQLHGLDGFTGEAEYSGAMGEFIPYLKAAQWTGVGRQTVWGKGELSVRVKRPDGR
jgi:hypothetical protein